MITSGTLHWIYLHHGVGRHRANQHGSNIGAGRHLGCAAFASYAGQPSASGEVAFAKAAPTISSTVTRLHDVCCCGAQALQGVQHQGYVSWEVDLEVYIQLSG